MESLSIPSEKEKIGHLVADTMVFLEAVNLNNHGVNIYTVPDVLNEVKNKRQLRRLAVLPYDLQVREPDPEWLKAAVEFSKKTGDYRSLSAIDMKVIALTYQLHKEHVGLDNVRTEPRMPQVISSKTKPVEMVSSDPVVGFYTPKGAKLNENDNESDDDSEPEDHDVESEDVGETTNNEDVTEDELKECLEKLKFDVSDESQDILKPVEKNEDNDSDEEQSGDSSEDDESNEDGEDDGGGWITPANISKIKKEIHGEVLKEVVPKVACMSSDFSIQNVLKQMNLYVVSSTGVVIKQIRTHILRCYACFKTTSVMSNIFCPKCGNKTLKKVGVSLDEDGNQVIHINTKRPLTAKYKNQSMPRFKGGKHSCNPIIFADQPIPRQMPTRVAKTKTNALDEDYTAGYSPFAARDVQSRSALLLKDCNVGRWRRNNAFEEARRKKSYFRHLK